MKTFVTKPREVEREWFVVDATDKTLGRLASEIAQVLRGKHKPTFAPHVDCGDYVIVINAGRIAVTGNRMEQKNYYKHSQYPGGLRTTSLRHMLEKYPTRPIKYAVKGMLPKGPLGRQMLTKLKVYAGSDHPHEAQQPKPLEF